MNLITIALAVFLAATSSSTEIYQKPLEPVKAIYYQPNHQQKVYLGAIQYCESNGRDKIKILDSNNKYSFGILQFQMDTFLRFGKKFNLIDKNLTAEEAEKSGIIYDIKTQEQIAYMMLNEGENHWINCSKLLKGKYPKNLIKSGSEMTL